MPARGSSKDYARASSTAPIFRRSGATVLLLHEPRNPSASPPSLFRYSCLHLVLVSVRPRHRRFEHFAWHLGRHIPVRPAPLPRGIAGNHSAWLVVAPWSVPRGLAIKRNREGENFWPVGFVINVAGAIRSMPSPESRPCVLQRPSPRILIWIANAQRCHVPQLPRQQINSSGFLVALLWGPAVASWATPQTNTHTPRAHLRLIYPK